MLLSFYLDNSFRSSWWVACTMLKSNSASSSKIVFMSSLLLYISMNHLASNLSILQCSGTFKEWLTKAERFLSLFFLTYTFRCFVENSLASSKIFSFSIERNEASYKDSIPFVSSQRHALKFPLSSMKLLKTSTKTNKIMLTINEGLGIRNSILVFRYYIYRFSNKFNYIHRCINQQCYFF